MEPKPAPIGSRYLLRFSKKRDEEKQDKISVDARLELEVTGEIFRGDFALTFFELKRGMERVVYLLHERDQRPDVAIAQARARIVPLQLFDEPARIINADVKLVVSAAEKSPGELAQLARVRARETRKLRTSAGVDQAIFQIDPDLRISPFEEALNLAEERLVHEGSKTQGDISIIVEVDQRI
jgi:hypothetical protein